MGSLTLLIPADKGTADRPVWQLRPVNLEIWSKRQILSPTAASTVEFSEKACELMSLRQ